MTARWVSGSSGLVVSLNFVEGMGDVKSKYVLTKLLLVYLYLDIISSSTYISVILFGACLCSICAFFHRLIYSALIRGHPRKKMCDGLLGSIHVLQDAHNTSMCLNGKKKDDIKKLGWRKECSSLILLMLA